MRLTVPPRDPCFHSSSIPLFPRVVAPTLPTPSLLLFPFSLIAPPAPCQSPPTTASTTPAPFSTLHWSPRNPYSTPAAAPPLRLTTPPNDHHKPATITPPNRRETNTTIPISSLSNLSHHKSPPLLHLIVANRHHRTSPSHLHDCLHP
ncbi:unnamed protein product [Sphenostylis stenocarpa]|uniref:Uncharacterized protein n=1 Tax=Sphenostylis stenocarpa TaxID=92480 RepID=A0AA86T1J1_9FABA|nr:unnamed protein product [Sphenostylis stenocarpa]